MSGKPAKQPPLERQGSAASGGGGGSSQQQNPSLSSVCAALAVHDEWQVGPRIYKLFMFIFDGPTY